MTQVHYPRTHMGKQNMQVSTGHDEDRQRADFSGFPARGTEQPDGGRKSSLHTVNNGETTMPNRVEIECSDLDIAWAYVDWAPKGDSLFIHQKEVGGDDSARPQLVMFNRDEARQVRDAIDAFLKAGAANDAG